MWIPAVAIVTLSTIIIAIFGASLLGVASLTGTDSLKLRRVA